MIVAQARSAKGNHVDSNANALGRFASEGVAEMSGRERKAQPMPPVLVVPPAGPRCFSPAFETV
jgi:hypothetical protein